MRNGDIETPMTLGKHKSTDSDASGPLDLYTVGRDGSGLTRLTDHFPPDTPSDPEWFPVTAP